MRRGAAALLPFLLACGPSEDPTTSGGGTGTGGDTEGPDPYATCPADGGPYTFFYGQPLVGWAVAEDGRVRSWGDDYYPDPPCGPYVALTANPSFGCGLAPDLHVFCWAWEVDTWSPGLPPALQMDPEPLFSQIVTGGESLCGVGVDAQVRCYGQVSEEVPNAQPPDLPAQRISMGAGYACALSLDGNIQCWGDGSAEDEPPTMEEPRPHYGQAIAPAGTFIDVAASEYTTCGIGEDEEIYCWGYLADVIMDSAPPGPFARVVLTEDYACATRPDRTVSCWLGDGTPADEPPPGQYTMVRVMNRGGCALSVEGEVVCWGPAFAGDPFADDAGTGTGG